MIRIAIWDDSTYDLIMIKVLTEDLLSFLNIDNDIHELLITEAIDSYSLERNLS